MKKVDLGEQLRREIKKRGLSTYGVAKESGVDRAAVVRFVNGDRDITLGTASKISSILGLELRPIRKGR